jgi:hypothetical protein
MSPPTLLLSLGSATAMILIALLGLAAAEGPSRKEGGGEAMQVQAEPARTGKERLGGKASDEQRLDNCKVPPELRGPTPRPDNCHDGAGTASKR